MDRREFLKFGGLGLAAVAVGGAGGTALFGSVARAATTTVDLTMVEVLHEMVDGVEVPGWAFRSSLLANAPRIPGPILFATEGDTIRILVKNEVGNGGAHGFAVDGVPGTESGPLAQGEQKLVTFPAPKPGTYLYLDPLNAPVNRALGLHGALVVLPRPVGQSTPYGDPTDAVQRLFADLGTTAHFPGHFWDPDRNAIWIFGTVDPVRHAQAANHATGMPATSFLNGTVGSPQPYRPQYFLINGKSGFFGAQHGAGGGAAHVHTRNPDLQAAISIHGHVGQPCLIRNLNAGLMWNSPHIHGNHVYLLAHDRQVRDHLEWVDTWTMPPGAVKEVLLPYIRPPDVPDASWARFENGTNQERWPLLFPMHDHNEISNTAAGGNYPQGLATHFQFDGPVDPNDEVILVDRADLRVRTGQLFLSGRSSGAALRPPSAREIMIHAGPDVAGPHLGTAVAAADGSWSFRGRGVQAAGTRLVTLHNMQTHAERRAVPLNLR